MRTPDLRFRRPRQPFCVVAQKTTEGADAPIGESIAAGIGSDELARVMGTERGHDRGALRRVARWPVAAIAARQDAYDDEQETVADLTASASGAQQQQHH